jgi:hypothetical protein
MGTSEPDNPTPAKWYKSEKKKKNSKPEKGIRRDQKRNEVVEVNRSLT